MGTSNRFSLKWNNYVHHITTAFDTLRDEADFVDCTLSCDGKRIKAHRMLLSACSSYFKEIFKENPCQHPVVILKGVAYSDLEALIDFMYNGEVSVHQEHLGSFLNTAELLQVRGLTDGADKEASQQVTSSKVASAPVQTPTQSAQPQDTTKTPEPPILPTPLPMKTVIPKTEVKEPPVKRKRPNIPTSTNNSMELSPSPVVPQVNESASVRVPVIGTDPMKTEPVYIELDDDEPDYLDENADDEPGTFEGNEDEYSGQSGSDSKVAWDTNMETTGASNISVHSEPGTSGEGTSQDTGHESGIDSHVVSITPDDILPDRSFSNKLLPQFKARRRDVEYHKTEDGRYECNTCHKTYKNICNVLEHLKMHSGRTTCTICSKVFCRTHALKLHMITMHAF